MEIVNMAISDIVPYERNPRKNSAAIKPVANSIQEFGFRYPIVVDENHVIISGHTRYEAAKSLGLETVPVSIADDLTEQQANALRLVDNKTSELSEWDTPLLELEKLNLEDFDLSLFGFESLDTSEIKEKKEQEKRVAELALKVFEHHDYLVFVFDNTMDWLNVCNRFGIEKADAGFGETRKIGLGRVVDGQKLLEKFGD